MKEPLAKSKEVGALRKRVTKQFNAYGVFNAISPEVEKRLPAPSDYNEFRRIENERQLESIKALLSGYMFNENVIVQGTVNDGTRVIGLSHFDVMMKAMNMFLMAMNMQNKLWGLYTMPVVPSVEPRNLTVKNVTVEMMQELQRIARKEKPALESRPADNGAPDLDLRGRVES